MSFEWKEVLLEEVSREITVGFVGSMASEYVKFGIPFLRSLNIEPYQVNLNDIKFITQEFHERLSKSKLKPGDVVIVRTGKPGTCTVIPEWLKEANCSDLVIVRPSPDIDPYFLAYYVNSIATHHVYSHLVGAVQQHFNVGSAKKIKILLPPLAEQKSISEVLNAISSKIELNNAINKNLEELAQALFKRWFVDFEFPNENGEPYMSSGGEFEESELGLIPKGWKQGTISELGEVAGGATPSKKNEDFYTVRGIPWITPKDLSKTNNKYISRGEIDITQKGFSNSSVKLLPKGTVLFSSRAPIGYIAIAKNEVTTNQGFKSVIPFKHVGSEFVYYLLKSNVETIECRASGSTFKEISGTEMKRVPVLIPTENVLAKFNEIVEPIGRLTQKCEEENEDLTQIRDTLLPKLMSGEIRVPVEQDHNHPDLPKVAESSAIYQP